MAVSAHAPLTSLKLHGEKQYAEKNEAMQENLSDKNIYSYFPYFQLNHSYFYSYLPSTEILINFQVGYS